MSFARKTLIAVALSAPLALGGTAFADEPVPDPTGTCHYDTAGTYTCATTQDVDGVGAGSTTSGGGGSPSGGGSGGTWSAGTDDGTASGSGSYSGTGDSSGFCATTNDSGTVAGTPVESGDQTQCLP